MSQMVTERDVVSRSGFCSCRRMEVNLNVKNVKNVKKLRCLIGAFGSFGSLLALGAISIHRPGLEAAFSEPLQDLVF